MNKYYILIVDDEENVSKLLYKVLKKEGYVVLTASCGVKAMDIIDNNDIDIVITDIKMPEMDGIELLKNIKSIDSSIDVVLITAFASIETAIEALRLGAKNYIIKPFNIDEITKCVKDIVKCRDKNYKDYDSFNFNIMPKKGIVHNSQSMKKVMKIIRQVADTKATVLISGETGTGKELTANALHYLSVRKDKPFIKVNCAAIPETLLESELFGYEKGAFTGAVTSKPGKFELAQGGTIFLDEIGEISQSVQVKLLRVLQEREFERLGGIKTIKIDVRIIAATNRELLKMVENNQFREDLYYRLNVVPIEMPPLRERKEDIPELIDFFLEESAYISGRPPKSFTKAAIKKLIEFNWSGNIRQLENVVERCVVITQGDIIDVNYLPMNIVNSSVYKGTNNIELGNLDDIVNDAEKEIIIKAIKKCSGNRTKAASLLGISRRSLHRKITKYSIKI